MSKRDIIVFLFKWKYSLIGHFLFIVATVTVLVYLLPQNYEAKAVIMVESSKAPVMRSDMAFGVDIISVLTSEIAIIQSKTVLSSAVDQVGVAVDTDPPSTIKLAIEAVRDWLSDVGLTESMSPRDSLIRKLEKRLTVEPITHSNIINISLSSDNPKWVSSIVNAVTDRYIDHHIKVFSSAGASEVYRLQIERLGHELDRRRKVLADYKQKAEVFALADTIRTIVQQHSELTSNLSTTRSELAELQTRFGPEHTKVSLVEEKIISIMGSLLEVQTKLQKLELNEAGIHEMEIGITSTEKSYQKYQKRYEEEQLSNLANPDVVNIRVIEYAAIPTRPTSSRIFFVFLSVVGGFVLSFAIAFIKEYFDHSVTDPDYVAQLLGVPTLGSVERI